MSVPEPRPSSESEVSSVSGERSVPSPTAVMEMALQAASRGPRGANPLVGAILTGPDGHVLSVGWHRGAGTAHAEVDALRTAEKSGHTAAGGTLYVTLEPCNHTGRTGPCSQAILAAGVRRVVYAMPDAEGPARGGGQFLRDHGVSASCGLRETEARALNARWFTAREQRRPFVTLKIAQTMDGFAAAADGSSQWITGAPARQDGHRLRRLAEAIVVGAGTAEADNPQLTAREDDGTASSRQPLRVVAGRRDLSVTLRFHGTDNRSLQIREREPRLILDVLFDRGISHVLLEGGPTLAGSFVEAGLVDEVFTYMAPAVLGAGKPALAGLAAATMTEIRRWDWDATLGGAALQLGTDLRLHLQPHTKGT